MAVTEGYVVGCLLRETESATFALEWVEADSGGYVATFNLVLVRMYNVQNMSGPRLCLEFRSGQDKTYIQEPRKVAILGRQYRNDEDQHLAGLLRSLQSAVAHQVRRRYELAAAKETEIRESIFRRLLFGAPGTSGLDAGQ